MNDYFLLILVFIFLIIWLICGLKYVSGFDSYKEEALVLIHEIEIREEMLWDFKLPIN